MVLKKKTDAYADKIHEEASGVLTVSIGILSFFSMQFFGSK